MELSNGKPRAANLKRVVQGLARGQRGVSLLELLVVIALVGFVGAAITATAFQAFIFTTRLSNQMTAIRQVQQAGFWVSPDVMMSQQRDLSPRGGKVVALNWTSGNGDKHEVTYMIIAQRLQRMHKVSRNGTELRTEVLTVAQYVESAKLESHGTGFKLTVTANVSGQTETREYKIEPRVKT